MKEGFQKHIQFLRNDIDKAIHQIPLEKSPTYFYDPIKYVLNGKGKRLRPILVHLTGQIFSSDPEGLMKAAIRDPNPVVFLENELLYGDKYDNIPSSDDYVIPIGRAKIERSGSDVTIVAFSIMVGKALKAAEELAEQGIDAEVINLRTIRPLDRHTILESVKKTNRIVVAEEGWPFAGIGSEIAALIGEHAFDYLDAPLARVCAKDVPLPYAANLEALALPQSQHIVEAAKKVCYQD